MAIILNATVGATDANSYLTVIESNILLEPDIRNYTIWNTLLDADKTAWIVFSTSMLDYIYNYIGDKATETQKLLWPRINAFDRDNVLVDDEVIPNDIKLAVAEYACWLSANDPFALRDTTGFKMLKVDVITLEIDKFDRMPIVPTIVKKIMQWWGTTAHGNKYGATYRSLEKA